VEAIVSLRGNRPRCGALGAGARRAFERNWDRPVALGLWRGVLEALDREQLQR
jgi:hypothetical protein